MSWNPTAKEHALLLHVLATNGIRRQGTKAVEEFAEAAAAIARFSNRDDPELDHVAEELADAEIMQAQLCEIYPELKESIARQRDAKLARMAVVFGFKETI